MRRRRIKPLKEAEDHVLRRIDKTDALEAKHINEYKGRGVFALIPFIKGDFVVEYRGEMITLIEAEQRREANQDTFFMFDFIWQNKKWSIDATHEDGTLGRLINDDHINPNCTMKRIIVEGKPCLCLFAARDIFPGEELTYDYGGSHWPWRKPPCNDDDNMTAIENCSEDSVTTAGTSRFTAEPPCNDDDNMTAIENCSEDSVTTAGTSRFTAEPPCNDDDNMTAIENCSEDSVTTAGTSRFTAEPLVDYSDSEDEVLCSKIMTSYNKRSVIRDDSDDLFENSSVNSKDIQDDVRRNHASFAMNEQHSACTTASKRAKNTRARGKIAEYSDGSSEDELSVSEEEYIPDTSESYTSDSSMSFTASPKECTTVSSPQHNVCENSTLPADPVSKKKRGYVKKTAWNKHEIQAVEKHMMRFINNRKIPGKADCMRCKEAEPLALKDREWSTLKFYIKNRISALNRKDLPN